MPLIFGLLLSLFASVAHADLCGDLLQSPSAQVQLPLDSAAVQAAMVELYGTRINRFGANKASPFASVRTQSYLREIIKRYEAEGSRSSLVRAKGLREWLVGPSFDVQVSRANRYPRDLVAHAENEVRNELLKISENMRNHTLALGRKMTLTFGPITLAPANANMKNVIPRGWTKPWDVIPGVGGGREGATVNVESLVRGHGSKNLSVHEFLHNVDFGYRDTTGLALSDRPEFRRLWRETAYGFRESYQKNYPEEAFAEFGAWFYHSDETREMLRDLYPEWYSYFAELSERL